MTPEYLGICVLCSYKIPAPKRMEQWYEKCSTIAGKGKWVCGHCLYKLKDAVHIAVKARKKVAKKVKRNEMREYGVKVDPTSGKLVKIGSKPKL
jgi:hypothetical protein|tara:strand:+ start:802 stop:1083 length:282 start_codon:yes stop_codon:yes gene_type:complete